MEMTHGSEAMDIDEPLPKIRRRLPRPDRLTALEEFRSLLDGTHPDLLVEDTAKNGVDQEECVPGVDSIVEPLFWIRRPDNVFDDVEMDQDSDDEDFCFNEDTEPAAPRFMFSDPSLEPQEMPAQAEEDEDDLQRLLYEDFKDLTVADDDAGDDCASVSSAAVSSKSKIEDFWARKYRRYYGDLSITNEADHDFLYDKNVDIYDARDEILRSIANNHVTIIYGCTGTGKTTHVPLFILDEAASRQKPCRVVISQPRRIAATSNCERVVSLRKMRNGQPWKFEQGMVSYHVGMSDQTGKETQVTFATTGVLLKTISSCRNLHRFTHVILDEVHERDQDMDLTLMLVKKMMEENSSDVKLIIMSATMDVERLEQYFDRFVVNRIEISDKRRRKIKSQFLDDVWPKCWPNRPMPTFLMEDPGIPEELYKTAISLIEDFSLKEAKEKRRTGTVLIFLPGMAQITEMEQELQLQIDQRKTDVFEPWEILTLHSNLNLSVQKKVMDDPSPGRRRIILSTNIAESSITIKDVDYVIDFVLTKRLMMDKVLHLPRLTLLWTSKANAVQRKGRTGRVTDGYYYCMVPEAFFQILPDYEEPEIKTAPIYNSVLHVKSLKLPEEWKPSQIFKLLLDPPTRQDIELGILKLKQVGALSLKMNGEFVRDNGNITRVGYMLQKLPLDAMLGRLILLSYAFGLVEEGITIAAGLSVRNVFATNFTLKHSVKLWLGKKRMYDAETNSDPLLLLNVYDQYIHAIKVGLLSSEEKEKSYCRERGLDRKRIREMKLVRDELGDRLEQLGLRVELSKLKAGEEKSSRGKPKESIFTELEKEIKDQQRVARYRKDLLRVIIAGAFYPFYFLQEPVPMDRVNQEIPYTDPMCSVSYNKMAPNNGPLYEDQLRKMYIDMDNLSLIPPTFFHTNDRTYAVFHRCLLGQFPSVPDPMRLALGIRRRDQVNELDALEFSKEYERNLQSAMQLHKQRTQIDLFFIKKATFEISSKEWPQYSSPDQLHEVAISDMENPSRIFFQLHSDRPAYLKLLEDLTAVKKRSNSIYPPVFHDLKPGSYCLALYTPHGETVSRAGRALVITEIPSESGARVFTLFFVDTGMRQDVPFEDIRWLPGDVPGLATIPAFAYEFTFSELRIKEVMWSDAKDLLRGYMNPSLRARFFVKVYCALHSVIRGELIIRTHGSSEEINLNRMLLDLGYAYSAAESRVSETKHETNRLNELHGPKRFSVNVPQNLRKLPKKVTIMGPYNPIKARFRSAMGQLTHCGVRCVSDSINGRVYDPEPELGDGAHVLMVASNVERAANNEDYVVLQNTTLLPRQPGLVGILVTLFSPSVQLEYDETISPNGYTSALAGAGFRPSKKDPNVTRPLYGAHDLHVDFDAPLTPFDVEQISDLRGLLNSTMLDKSFMVPVYSVENGYKRGGRWPREVLVAQMKMQKHCQSTLLRILTQPRKPCQFRSKVKRAEDLTWNPNLSDWSSLFEHKDEDEYLKPIRADISFANFEAALERSKKEYDLLDFHQRATRHFLGTDQVGEVLLSCPICPLTTNACINGDGRAVWEHMNSSGHKAQLRRFMANV